MVPKLPPVAAPIVKSTETRQTTPTTAPTPQAAPAKAEGWKAGGQKAAKSGAPPLSEAEVQRFKQAAEETKRSQAEALARQGGLTVRAAVNGTVGALNQTFDATVGAAVNGAVNLANRALGTSIPNLPSTAQSLGSVVDRTLPKPETATERVVQQVASAMAGAGAMGLASGAVSASAAANSTVRAVAAEMGANQALNVASAAGSAAGSSLTAEAGGGTAAQVAAGIVGGIAPGAISSGVRAANAAATAGKQVAANAESAKKTVTDLIFEFDRVNARRDPAVLKPLMQEFQRLKAAGHPFTPRDLVLARQVELYLGSPGAGPVTYAPGTFDSI